MKAQKIKILIAAILSIVTALSFNVVAFAETDDDFIIEIPPEETETMKYEDDDTSAPETTKPSKPDKPTTTHSYRPNYNNNSNSSISNNVTPPTESKKYQVKLELNNGEEAITVEANADGFITVPETPEKEGFKFAGWYSDSELKKQWDFLSSVATEDTVLYAKWEEDAKDILYLVDVSTSLGGIIKVNPTKAKAGEKVTITVEAEEGNALVEGSISVNGKFIDGKSFIMPEENVIVEAQFELTEVDDKKDTDDDKSLGKIITIAAIAVVAVVIIIVFIINRRRFAEEPEEDELFFVEPLSGQPAIRHDDFIRIKREQQNNERIQDLIGKDEEIGIINENEIRKIDKTGNINLDV